MKELFKSAGGAAEQKQMRELAKAVLAAVALHGMNVNPHTTAGDPQAPKEMAAVAVAQADALMAQLEK